MSIQNFCNKCQESGITPTEIFVLGKGCSKTTNYRYRLSSSKCKESKYLFAIQYCKDIDVFVAWNLQRIRNRIVLTVKSDNISSVKNNEIMPNRKNLLFSGWGEEDVLAFRESAIAKFLNEYVLK